MISSLPPQVWLLAAIQALAMSAGACMVLAGGIVGADISPSQTLATLPVALMIVGTASGVLPATMLMRRFGRKPVFIGASVGLACVSLLASIATSRGVFGVFALASFGFGLCLSAFQQIRFAAIESVAQDAAAKATSTVLMGGLVAAVIGPEMVSWGHYVIAESLAGSFVFVAMASGSCALLFTQYRDVVPDQQELIQNVRRRREIASNPVYIMAVATSVIGFALMSFIMTATPVHMHVGQDFTLEHTKWVIQSHIIAMYFPSFISAWLINRLGIKGIVVAGVSIYIATLVIGFFASAWLSYWLALVLLGVGWNFLFLAGTVLLPRSYSPAERFKAQGLHDFTVFAVQATAALSAGALLMLMGWQSLMQISASLIMVYCIVILSQQLRLKRSNG